MSNLHCRYNNAHVVKAGKLLEHEEECPDRLKRDDIKVCPYDKNHKVNAKLFQKHLEKCTSKPKIDPNIHREMSAFISKSNVNQSCPWDSQGNLSVNAWDSNSSEKKEVKAKRMIEEECKEMDYSEEDHIFLEAYLM